MSYEIHPDIKKAYTLPGRYYQDQEVFDKSKDSIFLRSWQYIADLDEMKSPGMVYPQTILPGVIDENIILTRDNNDKLHCLSNVCTHRANLVVEQPGIERNLRCRYHGRKFNLNGCFQSMPEFEEVENFPSDTDNLKQLELDSFGNLLFASLDPHVSIDKYMEPIKRRMNFLPMEQLKFDPTRSRDYLVDAHWALYVDNYLEGFHIPYVHFTLNEEIDYNSYRDELFEFGTLQIGYAEGSEYIFELPEGHIDSGDEIAAYYFWLFPNIMFNFYPWGLSLNIVRPIDINRTKIEFRTYIWKPDLIDQGAGSGLDRVEREDEIVVENVAKGLKNRSYDKGRFSPKREKGVHHFHRLLAKFS